MSHAYCPYPAEVVDAMSCPWCKSPQRARVEYWANTNTTLRCIACSQVLKLIPGQCTELLSREAPHA
jgi:hypothetical protein